MLTNSFYHSEGFLFRVKKISGTGTVIDIGLRLQKDPLRGNDTCLTVKKVTNELIKVSGKKTVVQNKNIFAILYIILLKGPLERLPKEAGLVTFKNGKKKSDCGKCLSEKATDFRCHFCGQGLHQKCSEEAVCAKKCPQIRIEVQVKNSDLVIINGKSKFYEKLGKCMIDNQILVSNSALSEKALEDLDKILKSKPKGPAKGINKVLINEVAPLKDIAEDWCLSYRACYAMFQEGNCRRYVDFQSKAEKHSKAGAGAGAEAAMSREVVTTHPGLEEVLDKGNETEPEDWTPDWKITDLILGSGFKFLKPTKVNGDCWFSSIIEISLFYGDLHIPSDTVRLRAYLLNKIMRLPMVEKWVADYFGGNRYKFNAHMKRPFMPREMTDDFGLVCLGTAIVINRRIRIIGEGHATTGGFNELNSNEETLSQPIYWVGHEKLHFRAIAKPEDKGCAERKRLREKKKINLEEKDELRRRKEKEKSQDDTDVEALRLSLEVMQRKCAIAENELKLAEQRGEVQSVFILSLEKRLANCCKNCQEQDPDLIMASREHANLLKLKEMLLRQEKMISEINKQAGPEQEKGEKEKPGEKL